MEGQVEPPSSELDPQILIRHISNATRLLIDCGDEALEPLIAEKIDIVKKFATDQACRAFMVERIVRGDVEDAEEVTWNISTDVRYGNNKATGVIFIKKGSQIETDKSLPGQMQSITLSEDSPYETLHLYLSCAVSPFFKSYLRESSKASDSRDFSGDKMAPSVEKKLVELEMGLLHLQQNVDIPEIQLTAHPSVQHIIRTCAEQGRRARVQDMGSKVDDSTYLNTLQNLVNRWIKEIQKVTRMERDPSVGTALQEVSFWLNLERALLQIQEMRDSAEVQLTLDILKHGKRFHATVSFDTDTGLKQSLAKVNDYSPLMKDFPLNELFAATEVEKIRAAVHSIFSHLKKIRSCQEYPVQRALRLIEAISRDLCDQMNKVLSTRRLMHIQNEEFEKLQYQCFEVFSAWDEQYETLQGTLRDIAKKKREEPLKISWRVNPAHKLLQTRIDQMRKFRRQHEQLRTVISRVLRTTEEESGAIGEIDQAYEVVKEVDCLDTTKEGVEAWEAAISRYDERIDRVESRITARLRDQLGQAKSANEMFRIFSRFNALFIRPHIRGAIREYQNQLIHRVKEDIAKLYEKFKVQYQDSRGSALSDGRDIPPVSGSIIWARQIERQLETYLRRVEDVLGKGWEDHSEGQKLKEDGDAFRGQLDAKPAFESWVSRVNQRNFAVSGPIFSIEKTRVESEEDSESEARKRHLRINFQQEIITLSKEVRNLKWLGFRVPLTIINKAHQANQLYPFAVSLKESVNTYSAVCQRVASRSQLKTLLAERSNELIRLVQEGAELVWDSYKLENYTQRFQDYVFVFQEKVDDLIGLDDTIAREVKQLATCPFSAASFGEILATIQRSVDEMANHLFSNLVQWVNGLDQLIEDILARRLEEALIAWADCLEVMIKKELVDDEGKVKEYDDEDEEKPESCPIPQIKPIGLEMRLTNQMLFCYPPTQSVYQSLIRQLQDWQNTILRLPRIQAHKYLVGVMEKKSDIDLHYRSVISKLPSGNVTLDRVYESISTVNNNVDGYVKQWLHYQFLWDMQSSAIYQAMGTDVTVWQAMLVDVRKRRQTFDTSETVFVTGPVTVEFGKVQSKVSLKYDAWHKEMLASFGTMMADHMTEFHCEISRARTDLENSTTESAHTSDAVQLITQVQKMKRQMKQWESKVDQYRSGQKLLEKQRFQFPSNWLYIDNIDGEWSAFQDIHKRKDTAIQSQIASLQLRIVSEDKVVEEKTGNLLSDWDRGKPVAPNLKPSDALNSLQIFTTKFQRIEEDRENQRQAKEALELADTTGSGVIAERLQVSLEEMNDLKEIWTELSKITEQIEGLKDQSWQVIQPRKLRQSLDQLREQMKTFPARLRQYASYEHVMSRLKAYIKSNWIIVELKSSTVKERHWKQLIKKLRVTWNLMELVLGDIWDLDLTRHEPIFKEILLVAQGEMALEQFLNQVKEAWQNYELDLINYQNKCKLIRGWDDLFNKLKEHITSVSQMRLSPYYKVFEDEASSWDEKLNRMNVIFDLWIDVQRRWVYLEGIFTGSADLPHLLPQETQRFASISSEFLNLMKKVARAPLVLDIITIPGVQRNLERLGDLLAKIQKALGEYLERERSAFPRFYFVGDEDLLEIIGNSKAIGKLQKHFKKMFAGIHGLILSDDEKTILGVSSKEGEELKYINPVDTVKFPKINEWLGLVEKGMKESLAKGLSTSYMEYKAMIEGKLDQSTFFNWLDSFQSQLVVISSQIHWTTLVETAIDEGKLDSCISEIEQQLNLLADSVLQEQPPIRRKKIEHLIMESVYQRDTLRALKKKNVTSAKDFEWLMQMRFYYDGKEKNPLKQLQVRMANAQFYYGFEYLGLTDKLVQTPLTTRCWLTMTQALDSRLGGSPFGPAGTGKTESVKALGNALGRFTLVFNCDETFDFQAMGRIFIGLCQVGAWGCFDEFNRLEERILSAVSQQIQTIQEALKLTASAMQVSPKVQLLGKSVGVSGDMAIFITMNPGYAGRSNLPDNLKKLFRSLAMTKPDRKLIAEVLLYSQGFRKAELLSKKIVPFFELCFEQLSSQSHYDFGLRALKSVLASAGNVKRSKIVQLMKDAQEREEEMSEEQVAEQLPEQEILIQAVSETMLPKLVADDIPLLHSLLSDVFPNIPYTRAAMEALKEKIKIVCKNSHYVYGDVESDDPGSAWVDKVLQLCQIQTINHGLMMVGPSGSGKSAAWKTLLNALELLDGTEGVAYVIDPKAISKEELYGNLDPNTREWTDGLFTAILRRIVDNVRGEAAKRHWIIFDGDVDPEWVENLNSVLDDNKLLTLPNGERLGIPPNLRIMFEVEHLKYATLATVSRCGMIWFSEDVLTTEMICRFFLNSLQENTIDSGENSGIIGKDEEAEVLAVQAQVGAAIEEFFTPEGLVAKCLEYSFDLIHIMEANKLRMLDSLFSMLRQAVRTIVQYNQVHPDFPIGSDIVEKYCQKFLIYSMVWCFSGDGRQSERNAMCDFIARSTVIPLPPISPNCSLIDYMPDIATGEWSSWTTKVPQVEIETHRVTATDVVIPTLDTVRHESLLYTWLAEHKPLCLCGPPGSGKTMTLFSALRSLPDLEVVGLNFSSATTPELLLKTFEHYCEYRRTPNGIVMSPIQLQKWLVLFCDEINLPDYDKYGTQRVISFLRQIVERQGFYRKSDQQFVRLERIQIVGACNPPTDPGRKPMTNRFLRHVPVVYVDYPGAQSLMQIYGTFNRAMLRLVPDLRTYSDPLTASMVDLYTQSQERFTQDMQPHYIYSPREMSRWVRGIAEALKPLETLSVEGLVRIWAHEALRLFHDRLVYDEERQWTESKIDEVATKHFPNLDRHEALKRPILYSNWLSKDYVPVDREELREYVKARLRVFYEEELDVPLVLFNSVLDHVLRIDRIFRQPQGHLLFIGTSGSGKTTLSRFVAWMNGLSVFQVKVHRKYTGENFDDDLRNVLRRAGCKGEKIAFIMDESNVLDSSFLERMNTLLANGEVPGLFEGDELSALMTMCKEGAAREGLMLDSQDELYRWFTNEVTRNLHVVFTMNPAEDGLAGAAATSPALFNRCVLNWFGDWNSEALYQVGLEFTNKLDLDRSDYAAPAGVNFVYADLPQPPTQRQVIVDSAVFIHKTLHAAVKSLQKRGDVTFTLTPRHYLDFIQQYTKMMAEKRSELEEQQVHLNVGLRRINETVQQVDELRKELAVKKTSLETANTNANLKLQIMIKGQNEAEQKKRISTEMRAKLEIQQKKCAEKKAEVEEDLSKVEPAVNDAKNAVKSIKKNNLQELKALANPPAAVKMALESVCLLLGDVTSDWKTIRQLIVKDGFIASIVGFDSEAISDKVRKMFKEKFLSDPNYNFEKINKASKACGPLVKWASAQLNYSDMLKRVDPLRQELKALMDETTKNERESVEMNEIILQLEKKIEEYKREYADLIGQAESIKNEMKSVESKVSRSEGLLANLGSEQSRWQETSTNFRSQMSTLAGDCLLSSAFVAYAGYFDQEMRSSLFSAWQDRLTDAEIEFRRTLAQSEYLSTVDKRMEWQNNNLPVDELCIENAIMLERYNRYPLIVDPSGQATGFILKQYQDKKIVSTSFLDDAFRKQLESCLRFGNPILVNDAESYDPILNPVLNREVRRSGGRVLITIGDQDIDLSPSFRIFLATRDPTHEFSPPLCSRVTLVNFTVTRSSLQSQCLSHVLRAERPDVDAKRTDMLKLQGEYQLRLRQLEKQLLSTLNDVKGRILDDDSVITALEKLKTEAKEISEKSAETDTVMAEIERVSNIYAPLSQSCSSIFFTLDALHNINKLYQFSLNFFFDIFKASIESGARGSTDKQERLDKIVKTLFISTYKRASRSLLHQDRICFALLLAKIELELFRGKTALPELTHFLTNQEILIKPNELAAANYSDSFNDLQKENMIRLHRRMKQFGNIETTVANQEAKIIQWMQRKTKETPVLYESDNNSEIWVAAQRLLTEQALRPSSVVESSRRFVATIFGPEFEQADLTCADVTSQVAPNQPILLASLPGTDASYVVDDLARTLQKDMSSVAMGSPEGFTEAEKAISSASRTGKWVLLKNVHLAPSWLQQLEKKLHSLKSHQNFRLFLTAEISPKLPVNMLRTARILTYEPPPGMKSSLTSTFTNTTNRMQAQPAERARLYFLLGWFHAVVQERMRYTPLGWSKTYEFSDAELRSGCDTIDQWLDIVAKGRSNISPEQIPWKAISTLLSQAIYGGKIDNSFDQRVLDTFLNKIFTAKSFDENFRLAQPESSGEIVAPEGTKSSDFQAWVAQQLPPVQKPSFMGLPDNAETVLLAAHGREMVRKCLLGMTKEQETAKLHLDGEPEAFLRPAWMSSLLGQAQLWLNQLPGSLTTKMMDQRDPLARYFTRETARGISLLKKVRANIKDIIDVCEGRMKQTNETRALCDALTKQLIPEGWRKYKYSPQFSVTQWILDFSNRINQLADIEPGDMEHQVIWLGGLFQPEAWITATHQAAARKYQLSLEDLELDIEFAQITEGYQIKGLRLCGAVVKGKCEIGISGDIQTEIPMTSLLWKPIANIQKRDLTMPVYRNGARQDLLFTASVASTDNQREIYERGIAFTTAE